MLEMIKLNAKLDYRTKFVVIEIKKWNLKTIIKF